jgi:hypothetical protein
VVAAIEMKIDEKLGTQPLQPTIAAFFLVRLACLFARLLEAAIVHLKELLGVIFGIYICVLE